MYVFTNYLSTYLVCKDYTLGTPIVHPICFISNSKRSYVIFKNIQCRSTWSKLWTMQITLNLSKYDYFWFKYILYVWKNTFCIEIFFTTFCCILLHLQSWKKILVSLMANSISLEVWYPKFHWNLFKSVTTFNIKVAKSQKAFTFSSNL